MSIRDGVGVGYNILKNLTMSMMCLGEVAKMRGKGKSEEDVREYTELVREVIQAINSKQLIPTIRSEAILCINFLTTSKKYLHTYIHTYI